MKSTRPVFLNLFAMRFPIAAIVSILHRVSGIVLFVASFYLLWLLWLSLDSEANFALVKSMLNHPIHLAALWITLSMIGYHLIAGFRHLLLDLHIGDSLKAGRVGAVLVLILSALLSIALGVWLWL